MTDEKLTNLAMISIESETENMWYVWVDKNICIFENLEKSFS